jgi:hypothetical protein
MDLEYSHQFFIGSYDDCLDEEECNTLIDFFENREQKHYGSNQIKEYKHLGRNDISINLLRFKDDPKISSIVEKLRESIDNSILIYKDVFFTYNQVLSDQLVNPHIKMQKTPPRGGYHVWHCELTDISSIDRSLAWIMYLNDVPDGEGETEFLWQGIKIKPKRGRCVIWPAHFTHVHRGNPVYTTDKYILTGWICYQDVIDNHPGSPFVHDKQYDFSWRLGAEKNLDLDPDLDPDLDT